VTDHPAPGSLLDLTPVEARATITRWLAERGLPRYRADQLVRRLWVAPIESWAQATELPVALRAELAAQAGQPDVAKYWANAVLQLWGSGDPIVRSTVEAVRGFR